MSSGDHPMGANGSDPRGDLLDQLDAALSARRRSRSVAGARMAPTELAPLLSAADALAPLAEARPSIEFSARLEAQLMARVEARKTTQVAPAPLPARSPRRSYGAPRRRLTQLTWAAVAACVLLGMTVGALTASAHPGAPFYSLRKVLVGISDQLTGASATTARDELQRANAALAVFNSAASRGDDAAALTALAQLTQADRQASDAIAQIADDGQRATLQSQLDTLHTQEIPDLRAALPHLDWPARIQVTSALHGLKAAALVVTSARIEGVSGGDSAGHDGSSGSGAKTSNLVKVSVNGAGFTPGAVLLINGKQVGVVDAVTPQTLVAHLDAGALPEDVTSVGVGEPDGSAASTARVESGDHGPGDGATPEPGDHQTPGPGATSGSGEGGDGTPNPQETPSVSPSPSSDH